jgi:uncharacterized membrane protein YqjE
MSSVQGYRRGDERRLEDFDGHFRSDRDDASLGTLLGQLGSDVGDLVSAHTQLAVLEVREDLEQRAKASAMFGGAGIAAFFALLLLSFAAAWGLAEVMATGFAFLIVGLVYVIAAAILFFVGRSRMQDADVVPRQTIETIQEDVEWARRQLN